MKERERMREPRGSSRPRNVISPPRQSKMEHPPSSHPTARVRVEEGEGEEEVGERRVEVGGGRGEEGEWSAMHQAAPPEESTEEMGDSEEGSKEVISPCRPQE